jgi:hypothetical protein
MEKFFNKLPSTFYDGIECLDLTRRVKIASNQLQNVNLYNPLELQDGLRADHISEAYYDDAELDWMVYLSNEMIDPYYEWHLSEQDFQAYLNDKYGSVITAMKKIKFYRNNWPSDDRQIPVTFYENTLPYIEKAYWSPVYGAGKNVIAYKRKQQNWVQNTNKVLQYEVTYSGNTQFQRGEIVDLIVALEPVGTGEVLEANSTMVIIQSVSGNVIANSTWTKTITGETSGANATTNSYYTRYETISPEEVKYWEPITYFDWEVEQNESKKILSIIDRDVVNDLAEQVRIKLRED